MSSAVEAAATQLVTPDDIERAAERISVLVQKTPVLYSRLVDAAAGAHVFFKCENLQRGGSFKLRGALNFLLSLSEQERKRGIVTFSSGNHAQAVAIAADYLGVPATIVMPTDAPKAKLESTKAYGPKIIQFDRLRESREEIARKISEQTGATVLPSYDHPWIIAGQGTAALELLKEKPSLEAIITPIGGGGLLSGALITAKAARLGIRVFGAEPELANDWYQSLENGERVEIAPPATIADGLRTTVPGKITFPIVQALAEKVVLVSEQQIKEAVRFLLSRMKILAEPSGAVAAAAVLDRKLPPEIESVGVILSGGNVDWDVLAAICGEAV
jgi:threonine dehydratase